MHAVDHQTSSGGTIGLADGDSPESKLHQAGE